MTKQNRETPKSREAEPNPARLVIVGFLVVAAAGAVIALSTSPSESVPAPASSPPAVVNAPSAPTAPITAGEVPAPPGITNPTPYQYDVATNRHYDPGHAHWHAGPPPAEGSRNTTSGTEVPAPPGITNPTPYQYDAATDRHYDPGHAHWHSGPPPR